MEAISPTNPLTIQWITVALLLNLRLVKNKRIGKYNMIGVVIRSKVQPLNVYNKLGKQNALTIKSRAGQKYNEIMMEDQASARDDLTTFFIA